MNRVLYVIKKARMIESLMMTPFFFMGYIFTQPKISSASFSHFFLVTFHFYLLIQSIYLLNSYFGKKNDSVNKRFHGITIVNKSTELKFVLFSLIFLGGSLTINYINHWNGAYLILINYFLWILYASSYVNLKSNFLMGSLVHFLSGIINFLIGYLVGHELTMEGVAISFYFSMLFVSGHMHHMIIDYEADKNAGMKTLPVIIGIKKTNQLSIFFIVIASIYFVALSFFKIVLAPFVLPVILTCIIHLSLFFRVKNNIQNFETRIRYRKNYRITHAIGMGIMVLIYLHLEL